ncbi:MAG: DUF4386 domain-containing protein [Chloroflexi bacterium]|nr:DUF4386 domain-containing protein [Chloroflexota bacterium]
MNTTSRFTNISLRTAAIIAGAGLLLMAILAPIAYLNTFQSLVKFDDAALTAQNILNSMGAFRTAIILLLIVALLDIIVAWAMYIVFRPADKKLSAITAWLRVIYGVIFAFAIIQLPPALNVLSADGVQAMSYLKAFQSIWDKSLILFGFHLLLLGYLTFKSGYVPKWLAVLLVVAAAGYIIDGFGKLLSPAYSLSISQFTFIGEVVLIFWLFWKGAKGFGPVTKP